MISKKTILWISVVLTFFVGIASWYTAPNISLKLFYILLIGTTTWYSGKNAGVTIAILSLLMWLIHLEMWEEFPLWVGIWGTIERVLIYGATVVLIDLIRAQYATRLQRTEERYAKIIESAIEGIIAVDEENIIRFMNSHGVSLLGYSLSEINGMNILALSRDQESRVLLERMSAESNHEFCPCEIQLTRKDGNALWLLVTATSSNNQEERTKETVLLLTDISERKRAEEELERRYEQISAMQRLWFGLAESLNLDQRLQNALKIVVQVTKFDGGLIYLTDESQAELIVQYVQGISDEFLQRVRRWKVGEGNIGISVSTGKAIFIDEAEDDLIFNKELRAIENIHGFAAIPLASKERLLGVLCIVHRQPYIFSEETKMMLQTFGRQIGFAIENSKLYLAARERERELREMSLVMVRLQEEERKRFAREIHDGLSQVLTVLKINTELTIKYFNEHQEKATQYLQEVLTLANEAEIEAKRLANDLRPAILDDFGLKAAIKLHATNYERRTGITIDLNLPFYEIRFDPTIETSVFRIVQELLANVAKHAQATKVTIQFLVREGLLALIVSDNGKGFDSMHIDDREKTLHHGLRNMRERVEFFGGTFRVESVKGRGSEILMEIPIRDTLRHLPDQQEQVGEQIH